MELKIKNGDYVPDGAGALKRLGGREELLQRVLYRLSVRRGSFALLPELGSRLHLLRRGGTESGETAAKQYAAEALANEEVTVKRVALGERNGVMVLTLTLAYEGGELAVRMNIGGE